METRGYDLPLRILTVGLRQFRRPDTNHPTWQKP